MSQQQQRLPSFRDYSDIQKVILPFQKNKPLSKKTYVPNLDVSRKVSTTKERDDQYLDEASAKKDESRPYRRAERKILQTDGIFSSGIGKSATSTSKSAKSSATAASSSSGGGGSSSGRNKKLKCVVEKLDDQRKRHTDRETSFKHLVYKQSDKLQKHLSISPNDLPVSVPRPPSALKPERGNHSKISSLLTDILKPNDEESPLFILKTPRYIPAVLDDSTQNPKLNVKRDNITETGYKCTIHDLPEGQIGKLQIMKSGRMRLVLGECKFSLQRGMKVHFKEELAVIKTDEEKKTAEIVNLGEIQDRIIVVPDNITELVKDNT